MIYQTEAHEPFVECLSSGVHAALGAAVGDETGTALEQSQSGKLWTFQSLTYQEGSGGHTKANNKSRCHFEDRE